jgi:hypothetical protein
MPKTNETRILSMTFMFVSHSKCSRNYEYGKPLKKFSSSKHRNPPPGSLVTEEIMCRIFAVNKKSNFFHAKVKIGA